MVDVPRTELILGGQKSGKSRRAEDMARAWLQADAAHEAVLLATGRAFDEEMRQRIDRHRQDRSARVPGLRTVEEPIELAKALQQLSAPGRLLVVDCLTMWLTNGLMPPPGPSPVFVVERARAELCQALGAASGPVVLVGNEIGLGVIPMGRPVRHFVDELGRLNQAVAAVCERVTLMVAGCALTVKETG